MSEIRAWSAVDEEQSMTREEQSSPEPERIRQVGDCPRGHEAPILPVDGTAYFVCGECGLLLTASNPADTVAA